MTPETKARIALLRPLLIGLVVSAHVPWTLYNPASMEIAPTLANLLNLMLTAVMSPIGMPILSVISGFLVVYSIEKYGYFLLIRNKVATVLIPMIVWNFAFATLIYWGQSHGWKSRPDLVLFNGNWWSWSNALLAIKLIPANGPLYFLRELFICFLLTPVFISIAKRHVATSIILALSAFLIVYAKPLPFIFRFDIYAWFFLGVYVSMHKLSDLKIEKRHQNTVLILGILIIPTVAVSFFLNKNLFRYLDKLITIIGPFYFWILAGKINNTKFGNFLKVYSKYSYTVFLSHAFVISACWQIWSIWVGKSPFDNFIIFNIFCTSTVFITAPIFYHSFHWWLSQTSQRTAQRNNYKKPTPSALEADHQNKTTSPAMKKAAGKIVVSETG